MKNTKKLGLLGLLLFITIGLFAQINLKDTLPVDPTVKIGKLNNGLTYYIKKNNKPENSILLKLAVKTGSVLETDGQKGLAHFCEHMLFNGTKNFPKNELVNYLQSIGMSFGGDINAYTSFDETVYFIEVPTTNKENVTKGFQVIEDWAHWASFDSKEIDKERGVIEAEWRSGLGADRRMMNKYFPVVFKGSKYANRMPIGDINIIRTFKYDTLRSFYKNWYRPDLEAVIVVGNIDVNEAETLIHAMFSDMKNPVDAPVRPELTVPANKEPLIAIATDPEATYSYLQLMYKKPEIKIVTGNDWRASLIRDIYCSMLSARLQELSQNPENPYIQAYAYYANFLGNMDIYSLMALCKENHIDQSLDAVLKENERVKKYGFLETELARQKKMMTMQYESRAKEIDKTESRHLADNIQGHFLNDAPLMGVGNELEYFKSVIETITLDEVNACSNLFVTDDNMVLVVGAPEKKEVKVPSEKELLAVIKTVKTADIAPWVDNFKDEPLVNIDELKGAQIISKLENEKLGTTEIKLANGITVVMKPTTFKNDEIKIAGYNLGGTSLAADKDFVSAKLAANIIDASGIGSFDAVELTKKLQETKLAITPYIDELKQGVKGFAAPADFETLMQLLYLYFEAPRKDDRAFARFMAEMETEAKSLDDPLYAYLQETYRHISPNNPRAGIVLDENQLKTANLDVAYNFYNELFSNANNSFFTIVGNFNVDDMIVMVQKYIGSLPSAAGNLNWKDNGYRSFTKKEEFTFYKGQDQGMVTIVMAGDFDYTPENRMKAAFLREVLNMRLIQNIREKMGEVYSPVVQLQTNQHPVSEYLFLVGFQCAPAVTEKVSKAVFEEMKKLQKSGPTDEEMVKARETMKRQYNIGSATNDYWISNLEAANFRGEDPDNILLFKERVDAVTKDQVKTAAKQLFNTKVYLKSTLLPENNKK